MDQANKERRGEGRESVFFLVERRSPALPISFTFACLSFVLSRKEKGEKEKCKLEIINVSLALPSKKAHDQPFFSIADSFISLPLRTVWLDPF